MRTVEYTITIYRTNGITEIKKTHLLDGYTTSVERLNLTIDELEIVTSLIQKAKGAFESKIVFKEIREISSP